jgi:hypothetical protein
MVDLFVILEDSREVDLKPFARCGSRSKSAIDR